MNAASRGQAFRDRRRQRGVSVIALFVVLSIGIFIGLFVLRVGPAYYENFVVNEIIAEKAADERLMRSPRRDIYNAINTAYRMNNLWDLKAEDTIRLKRDADRGNTMSVSYEKRTNLFANIDVVTTFGEPEVGAATVMR